MYASLFADISAPTKHVPPSGISFRTITIFGYYSKDRSYKVIHTLHSEEEKTWVNTQRHSSLSLSWDLYSFSVSIQAVDGV